MSAGSSAHYEAQRSLLEAGEYERLAREAHDQARRYDLAARGEASVAGRLRALEALGWTVLPDRRWAGSKRANVDCLLVGPGGVVVVDVKAWRALEVRNGSLFCEDECRDDEISKLLGLVDRVQDCVRPAGLTRQALWPALVFAGRHVSARTQGVQLLGDGGVASWVTRLGHRLDPDQVTRVCALVEEDFPAYDAAPHAAVRVPRLRMVMPARKPIQTETLFDVQELTDSLLEAALAAPIESWMTFLHPDQLRLVSSSHSGPSRLRGPAGTGKTVVGLHRALYLAERSTKRILFVTFVRTLPVVLGGLCERMSPTARANVEFTGIHQLALAILQRAGTRPRIDGTKITRAFSEAWISVGQHGRLSRLDERSSYWKEEIDYVIKGRGLTDFDDYASLTRTGRRTPMRVEDREDMWSLFVEYERRLDALGVHDFTDVLMLARDAVREGDVELDYGAVIVDEVHDLNLVGLELLHAISGDGPDGLHIIGDGQQAVYPGGFTLTEAGISVTGRATVLRTNYRNTVEILDAASRLVSTDEFDDLEGGLSAGEREIDVIRHGPAPLVVHASSRRSLEVSLTKRILDTVAHLRVPLGDMAVLVHTRAELAHYAEVLRRAGIAHIDLQDYDGVTSDRVKVGTFKRAKGLEFKFVLIPVMRPGPLGQWSGESDDSYRERAERTRRELYVGMTRARDGLWLGYLPD
ncbi:MAG: 3'-5' exonuclease [Nocardioides sp.]